MPKHLPAQRTVFLQLFFVVFVLFGITLVGAVLMSSQEDQEETSTSTTNQQGTNTAIIDEQSTEREAFLTAHQWYTIQLEQRAYMLKIGDAIETYDFGGNNAIIDLSSVDVDQLELGYEKISSTVIQIGEVNGERIVARSLKDGAELVYATIEYAARGDGRSLVIRGSGTFVDVVIDSLEFAQ